MAEEINDTTEVRCPGQALEVAGTLVFIVGVVAFTASLCSVPQAPKTLCWRTFSGLVGLPGALKELQVGAG